MPEASLTAQSGSLMDKARAKWGPSKAFDDGPSMLAPNTFFFSSWNDLRQLLELCYAATP